MLVGYHKEEDYGPLDTSEFDFYTNAKSEKFWNSRISDEMIVIEGRGKAGEKQYFIRQRFILDSVVTNLRSSEEPSSYNSKKHQLIGKDGEVFEIPLNDQPWFDEFHSSHAFFASPRVVAAEYQDRLRALIDQ
jgi:hypothetical protein